MEKRLRGNVNTICKYLYRHRNLVRELFIRQNVPGSSDSGRRKAVQARNKAQISAVKAINHLPSVTVISLAPAIFKSGSDFLTDSSLFGQE